MDYSLTNIYYTHVCVRRIVMVLLAFLLTIPTVHGEEETMDELLNMSLDEILEMTITGATRTEQTLKDVPSAVTVFTREQIQQLGIDFLDELANLVPGFQSYRMSDASIFNALTSRGHRIGQASAEVLVLIDGQRVEMPWTSGHVLATPKLPLSQIERVEFIRGPGSAVYGSNAMMGGNQHHHGQGDQRSQLEHRQSSSSTSRPAGFPSFGGGGSGLLCTCRGG